MFTQVNVEMARDEIRARYGGKWWVESLERKWEKKILISREDAIAYVVSMGEEPIEDTGKVDGNYAEYHV